MQQTLWSNEPNVQIWNLNLKTWFNRPSWTDLPCCWLISSERTLYVYCIFKYSLLSNTKQNWYCTVLLIGCWWGLGQQGVTSVISLQRSLLRYSLCTAHTTLRVTSELVNADQSYQSYAINSGTARYSKKEVGNRGSLHIQNSTVEYLQNYTWKLALWESTLWEWPDSKYITNILFDTPSVNCTL